MYTMDSIHSYEAASKQGGAAGEILVRKSLEKIFKELNVELDVKKSDAGKCFLVLCHGLLRELIVLSCIRYDMVMRMKMNINESKSNSNK